MENITAGKGALYLATINPELEQLLKGIPLPSSFTASTDIVAARNALTEIMLPAAKIMHEAARSRGVGIKDQTVTVGDGTEINIRIYSPPTPGHSGNPVYVAFHGGGFLFGRLENHDEDCIAFAEKLGVVSVNVEYRLAPEFIFPTAANDAWDVVQWVAANAGTIGGNLSLGFIVGGVSAGANLAAVTSILARDTALNPPLTGVHLSIPLLVAPGAVPEVYKSQYLSYEQNGKTPILTAESLDVILQNYKPDITSPLYSPLINKGGLRNLPPTYFQICGMDPLRDEGLIYKQELEKEGIKTNGDIYPGVPHAFWRTWPILELSKKVDRDTVKGVEWLLEAGLSN